MTDFRIDPGQLNRRLVLEAPAESADGSAGSAAAATTPNVTITSSDASTSWNYVWVAISIAGGTAALISQVVFTEAVSSNNLIVKSTAFTAAAAPASMKIVAQVEETDSITLNTDLIFAVSRDGGTTFTNATMNDRFTSSAVHVLESDVVDVGAQPSGTSVKWKITTANNKTVKIHGLYIYWS